MPTIATFDIGDQPVYSVTFTSAAGAVTDPSTVVWLYRNAAGVETSYTYGVASEVTRVSTGVYEFTVPTITAAGQHAVRAKGTAGLITAVEQAFKVRPSAFTSP